MPNASMTSARLLSAASGLALVMAGGLTAAHAQNGASERNVESIIVTAQKREQGVQDVPISIGAYDAEAIENAGVRDIKDLISIAPGLIVTSTQSETITTARIRGIGTVGDNFGLESSVGVYIDGIFRARNGVGFGDLGEIERIEVLRGPQGTLFGKNTSAGVINVITAQPEFEFGGSAEITVGDFGYQRIAGSVTGPLIEDVLAARLFAVQGERDGFYDVVLEDNGAITDAESDTQDYFSVRGQLLFNPSDTLSARIIADYTDRDEICCGAAQWDYTDSAAGIVRAFGGDVLNPADPDERIAFLNILPTQIVEDWGVSAEVDWDVGPGTLTTVAGFRNWENERAFDIDATSADFAFRPLDENFTNLERASLEIRYTGLAGKLDYLVGAFFSQEDLELGDSIRVGDDYEALVGALAAPVSPTVIALTQGAVTENTGIPGGSGAAQDIYNQEATSFAVFTHNTYNVTDQLALTGGLRYTFEEKDLTASFETTPNGCSGLVSVFGADPATGVFLATGDPTLAGAAGAVCLLPYLNTALDLPGYDQTREDEEISGTVKASFRVNEDLLLFGGYSRGFKAGGYNLDRILSGGDQVDLDGDGLAESIANVDTSFDPEIVDALELGFKSELLNNSLLLNANVFYQEVENYQLNAFNGVVFAVINIDETVSQGFEIDALYLPPVQGLTLQGGLAYTDATYEEVTSDVALFTALEGQPASLVPEYSLTGAVTYEAPIFGDILGLVSLDGRWVSEYNTGSDLDPEKEQDAFGLLNARIGVSRSDGLWSVEVFGKNLTDETYAQVAFDGFGQGGRVPPGTSLDPRGTQGYNAFLGAPRTWGVTLKTEF